MTIDQEPRHTSQHHAGLHLNGPHHNGPPHAGSARPGSQGFADRGPKPHRRQSLGMKILASVLSAGTVCGAIACGSAPGSSATVDVVPLSAAGADPFTPPVGRDNPDVAPFEGTGPQPSSIPGLYAEGTGPDGAPACDSAQLVNHLAADPVRATAWAQVFGISAAEIPKFAHSLTPALLRADTAVTDHRYRDGRFVAAPAVLARGTAVLVSSYGQPTVKCLNGNPLTAPPGPPPSGVTAVLPAPTAMSTLVFSTVGGDTLPGRAAPPPVGPTPAQIDAAQQARADAEAAAAAAQAADKKANENFTAWFLAHNHLGSLLADLNAAKDAVDDAQRLVDNWPRILGPVPPSLIQQLEDARAAQDRAQEAYDNQVDEVTRLKAAWDESRAKAADLAKAAEETEAEAGAAEELAGLPVSATSKLPGLDGESGNTDTSQGTRSDGDDGAATDPDTENRAETVDTNDRNSDLTTDTDDPATSQDNKEGVDDPATSQNTQKGADDGNDQAAGPTGGTASDSGSDGTHPSGDTAATTRD